MIYRLAKNTAFLLLAGLISCSGFSNSKNLSKSDEVKDSVKIKNTAEKPQQDDIIMGANQMDDYLPLLKNKNIGIVGNQTSVVFNKSGHTHLVDSLVALDLTVNTVLSPEHGFRGTASAGESVDSEVDKKTGIPIVSLYGDHKKPTAQDLENIEVLVFDIQDVGLRFYTYISTLHYIMEAAAENDVKVIVLDRPNPNGHYIDGPILEEKHSSFIGMHPVPVVHGMTIGEYAQMINGEKWLKKGIQADLTVIKMKNYTKGQTYSLPIKPSPNLPNDKSINLYSSLCFFEGTNVNAGRGTDLPFQVFGSPELDSDYFDFEFTPVSNEGAKDPKHENTLCYGRNLQHHDYLEKINLDWLIEAYQHTANKEKFFIDFFEKLAGTDTLRKQIEDGKSAKEIRKSWKKGLEEYDEMRNDYLLY